MTTEQLGDIITKELPKPGFEHLREKLMGWWILICIHTWEGVLIVTLDKKVLFKFFWTERVYTIVDSAKIGMKYYLPLLQNSNPYLHDSKDLIFYVEIIDLKIMIEDLEHIFLVHWSILISHHLGKLKTDKGQAEWIIEEIFSWSLQIPQTAKAF